MKNYLALKVVDTELQELAFTRVIKKVLVESEKSNYL